MTPFISRPLLLAVALCLASLVSPAECQTYSLSASLNASVGLFCASLAAEPPLNTTNPNPNPNPHVYPFSNPTLTLGTADPQLRTVVTTSGVLQGQAVLSTRVTAFTGIPYAQPPVGALRWLPPVEYTSSGTLNATTLASWCLQIGPLNLTTDESRNDRPLVGSEDCLYVNVWTPANLSDAAAVTRTLPVMVFIHGGAYATLSANLPDYDGLSWTNASDMVLVTFDYRLSTLGFFPSADLDAQYASLGYPAFSGNQGFLDQQLALRWVQSNIAAFGGSPDNVTIFGQSVGGAFICQHILSPQSRGLFHAGISESAINCDTSPMPNSLAMATNLTTTYTELVNCNQSTATARLACLRSVPAELFLALNAVTGSAFAFGLTLNGYDFPNPLLAFSTGNFTRVPLLLGTNALEYALLYELYDPPLLNYSDPTPYSGYVQIYSYGNTALAASASPANFNNSVFTAAINFQTLGNFTCAAGRMAGYFAQQGLPVYLYSFNHAPLLGIYNTLPVSAYHAVELTFLFGNTPSTYALIPALTKAELALRDTMRRYWVSFASTGNPNNGVDTEWAAHTTSNDASLNIDLTQSSAAWLSTYPTCALANQAALSAYANLSGTFTASCAGDVCTSRLLTTTPGSALGDPTFTSFHGARYQVHGIHGAVYAILSDPSTLINARFYFLSAGVCPPAHVRTACYSHPGSYFGSLALSTRSGARLLLQPGAAAMGFARIDLEGAAIDLSAAGTTVVSADGSIRVTVQDAWRVSVSLSNYELQLASSDHFVNVASVRVLDWQVMTHTLRPHGLLGQTWQRRHAGSPGLVVLSTQVEGVVDDYLEQGDDMFGYDTVYNRFQLLR